MMHHRVTADDVSEHEASRKSSIVRPRSREKRKTEEISNVQKLIKQPSRTCSMKNDEISYRDTHAGHPSPSDHAVQHEKTTSHKSLFPMDNWQKTVDSRRKADSDDTGSSSVKQPLSGHKIGGHKQHHPKVKLSESVNDGVKRFQTEPLQERINKLRELLNDSKDIIGDYVDSTIEEDEDEDVDSPGDAEGDADGEAGEEQEGAPTEENTEDTDVPNDTEAQDGDLNEDEEGGSAKDKPESQEAAETEGLPGDKLLLQFFALALACKAVSYFFLRNRCAC